MDRKATLEAKRIALEEYSRQRPTCPCCSAPNAGVRKHGAVLRSLILVIDDEASVVWMRLMRWLCECGQTFRHYPPGVVAHKRYVLAEIVERVGRMSEARESCFQVSGAEYVKPEAPEPSGERDVPEAERFMAPSTPWRWVGWLASLLPKVVPEWQRWLSGQSSFRPENWVIPPCRSDARRGVWSRCLVVLRALCGSTTDLAMPSPGS